MKYSKRRKLVAVSIENDVDNEAGKGTLTNDHKFELKKENDNKSNEM